MIKKYIGILMFFTFLLIPSYFALAQTSSAGFIPGNIWYSKDPFQEGDKIKIYTLIFNPDNRQLSGTVFFFNKTTFLGNKDFTATGKGLKDISIDWTATAGDNVIFAQIQNAKFLNSNNTYEDASLSETKTSESKRSVSKKITTTTNTNNISVNTEKDNIATDTISSVQNFITENTPEVVAKTIDTTTTKLETFRKDLSVSSTNKKEEVKKEIKNIEKIANTSSSKDTKVAGSSASNQGVFLKPFKYTELFALSLFSTVFNNKYIFYGLIVLVIFFIVRFVIKKIF